MGLLHSYHSRYRPAAARHLGLNLPYFATGNPPAISSSSAAFASTAAFATAALRGSSLAGGAAASTSPNAARTILACASRGPVSGFSYAGRQGVPKGDQGLATTVVSKTCDRWIASSNESVSSLSVISRQLFSPSFNCRNSSLTMPSVSKKSLLSLLSHNAVPYSLQACLATSVSSSAILSHRLSKAGRHSRVFNAAGGVCTSRPVVISWTLGGIVAIPASQFVTSRDSLLLKRCLMTSPYTAAAAAATARPRGLSAGKAAWTDDGKAQASEKKTRTYCAMVGSSGKAEKPGAQKKTFTFSSFRSFFSFSSIAAVRERLQSNEDSSCEYRRVEEARMYEDILPCCIESQWSSDMRCPQKAGSATDRTSDTGMHHMQHTERSVSIVNERSCNVEGNRNSHRNTSCNDESRDNIAKPLRSGKGVSPKEQAMNIHSNTNGEGQYSNVNGTITVESHMKTFLFSSTRGENVTLHSEAIRKIDSSDELIVSSNTNTTGGITRQKTAESYGFKGSETDSSSIASSNHTSSAIWKKQENNLDINDDTTGGSSRTEVDNNVAANAARCVSNVDASFSPFPQLHNVLQEYINSLPDETDVAVCSTASADPYFDINFASDSGHFPFVFRGSDHISLIGLSPSAAIVPPGPTTTALPSAGFNSSWPGSWMLLILTPLAAFLAAQFGAQHRQRVAICCEGNSCSGIPSTPGLPRKYNSNDTEPATSRPTSSFLTSWLPARVLHAEAAASVQEIDTTSAQQMELKQQQRQQQQHRPDEQLDSTKKLKGTLDDNSLPPRSILLFSSAGAAGQNDNSGSISSTGDNSTLEGVGGAKNAHWTNGGVGIFAEAANAPLEDRSLAVVLPLTVINDELFPGSGINNDSNNNSDSSMPLLNTTGETDDAQVIQELFARKAALVFPEEIKRRQQKDKSWRSLRLPSPSTSQATSLSSTNTYTFLTPGRNNQDGDDSDNRETKKMDVPLKDRNSICLLAAVIDGHGGPQVAEYVQQHLPRHVHRELRRAIQQSKQRPSRENISETSLTDSSLGSAVTQAFRALDDEIFSSVRAAYSLGLSRGIRVGACCTAVLLIGDKLLVANSGDCKAILSRRGGKEVVALNVQLNANVPEERQRLRKEHPGEDNIVVCKHSWEEHRKPSSPLELPLYYAGLLGKTTQYSACYVKGRLQPTRAFGDFLLKKPEYAHELRQRSSRRASNGKSNTDQQPQLTYPYITVDPVVSISELRGDEDFIVLGSDGVWDFLSDADVNSTVHASLCRIKEQATVGQTEGQTASLAPSSCTYSQETKENPVTGAIEAARTAAADIVRAVLQKAADAQNMTPEQMKACDPKRRRNYYDDTTAVVVLLGKDGNTRDFAVARSKL